MMRTRPSCSRRSSTAGARSMSRGSRAWARCCRSSSRRRPWTAASARCSAWRSSRTIASPPARWSSSSWATSRRRASSSSRSAPNSPSPTSWIFELQPPRDAGLIFAVGLAELRLQIGFLAFDHAALQDDQHRNEKQKHPSAGQHDGEPEIKDDKGDIDRVPREAIWAAFEQDRRWLARNNARASLPELTHGKSAKRKSNEGERAAGGKGACVGRAEPGPKRNDPAQETAKKNGAGEQNRRLHHHIGVVLHVLPP